MTYVVAFAVVAFFVLAGVGLVGTPVIFGTFLGWLLGG